jgi:hypothetical protein
LGFQKIESQTNEHKLKTHREIELPSAHIPQQFLLVSLELFIYEKNSRELHRWVMVVLYVRLWLMELLCGALVAKIECQC